MGMAHQLVPLLAATAMAASAASGADDATNNLWVARHALRDELWEIARSHASAAGTNEESRLIILESYAREGRWKDVKEALSRWPDAGGDGVEYYRAVASGDHAAAAKILERGGSKPAVVVVPMAEGHLAQALFPHLKNTRRFYMRPGVRVRVFW